MIKLESIIIRLLHFLLRQKHTPDNSSEFSFDSLLVDDTLNEERVKIETLAQERFMDPPPAWVAADWYHEMLGQLDKIEADFEGTTIPWEEAEKEMGRYA